MLSKQWFLLVTILTLVICVYSDHENAQDEMLNDSDAYSHLGHLRMPRARNGGFNEELEEETGLTREERKRLKAERRRLKEERRQERWARRQRQKQEGQRGLVDDLDYDQDPEEEERDPHFRNQHNAFPAPGTSSSSSSSVVGLPGGHSIPQRESQYNRESSSASSASSPSSATRSGTSGYVPAASSPTVVDLEWLRANLSSLWSVVRALSRQQGRPFLHRGGGRGRHHHSGVVAEIPNPESCPGGEEACRSEGGIICGGQGVCSCGHCFCHPGYYGTFCQCDDHSCPVYDGMTCGGPSRGQCRCGGCVCRNGYAGEACDCPTDTQTCTQPDSGVICSGKGTCECGRCRCGDGHKGMYCEDTVYAASVCEKLKSCVMCKAWNRELPSCAHCQITMTTVESLEPSMTTCVMVNSGCLLQFSYIPQTADAYTVLVPKDSACP